MELDCRSRGANVESSFESFFFQNFWELFLEFEETILCFAIDADEDDDNHHNFNSFNCDGDNDRQSSLRIVMVIVNFIISTCLIVK